ncbi:hypothetical protein EHI8A_012890 [Entamoeba histolytica HM-1:IMSS-B]|uniref:Uncharacterized protein n=6 Tax=Entamoeba histolytica TaxID=5759 RepID=C4MAZ5_ENTH1|nr:hypothetical protein EHI_063790 [Entamoeba histolytica HM-1:IMSS]EMD43958.1 Hypothetical protein EHI5A_032930 [Entamoeba histolytica KU27]EMH74633.1 hypothetical protein EHI8A_012890 [Entamoeba histolytica HM-1:IMSS-B]EMS17636.1 hypothetical protein KM1_040900 [Entamoeba histolytica HM-3:IMSS]ENY61202.1 hypothetical protein EHI7A_016390 [Entamoeba histolytica HM-1:IMSS-A]GAT99054.1 hypothetical protein CL6EHI_063790 [Entamoeba histolytica]|eukprot:XP_650986.1 hypothetical protein EHI_063790 [Entamoeba histolytica HM-1:IMSS]
MKYLLVYIYLLILVNAQNTCTNSQCKEVDYVIHEQSVDDESDPYWEDIIKILKDILGDNYVYIINDGDSPKEVFRKIGNFINNNWMVKHIKRVFETSIEFKGLLIDFYTTCKIGIKMQTETDKDKLNSMKAQLKKSLEGIRARVNLFRNWLDKTGIKEKTQDVITSVSTTLHKMIDFGATKLNDFTKNTKKWAKEKVHDLKRNFYNEYF